MKEFDVALRRKQRYIGMVDTRCIGKILYAQKSDIFVLCIAVMHINYYNTILGNFGSTTERGKIIIVCG